ncbi:annulin-like isoform X2 [Mercenaria mercenaria]|nr:annulin-like isoform X2 [Mercenaria mercenaria]XP_053404051.1 annulin-like isoform X2 [Mercenaria mercenaria]
MEHGTEGGSSLDNDNKLTLYERNLMPDWRIVNYDPKTGTNVPSKELAVTNVDLKIHENTTAHNTAEYDIAKAGVYDDIEQLVVRRGQEFGMTIEFNRPCDITKDDLRIILEFGANPRPSKGSRVDLKPSEKELQPNEWGAFIKSKDGNRLNVVILTPPNCPAAKWVLKIDVVKQKDSEKTLYRYVHTDPLYILFNPWCKDDHVYMEDDELRKEYVMNENGEIYVGSYRSIRPRNWEFAQFSGNVLECVMYLLDDVSKIKDNFRGDPVKITREMSSLVNSCDNSGVLAGKWASKEEHYSAGKVPWYWTGSAEILDQYLKNKKPVKYGQCWVFSGVLTTVCRSLGIPARSVTNFASAHDTDGSITIDKHFNSKGEEIEELNSDSVWNFHVWNDAWMARPDLPLGYGGWQAIDATPQEESMGVYRMGPMPIKAIKRGDLNNQYDGPFVFSEVNGDRLTWYPNDEGIMTITEINKHSIGKRISTKIAEGRTPAASWANRFCPNREDITQEYKFEDGSPEEREAIKRAHMHSSRKGIYEDKKWDTSFELDLNREIMIGQPFQLNLKIKNMSDKNKTVSGTTIVKSTDYRGEVNSTILYRFLTGGDTVLTPKEEKLISYDMPFEDYFYRLALDECFLKITCLCTVKETHQIFSAIEEMELTKPKLTTKVLTDGKVSVGQKFTVVTTFENPLPIPLTECELKVNGPGLRLPVIYAPDDVLEGGTFKYEFELTPVKSGKKNVMVTFNSKELHSIEGSHKMEISA